MEEDVNCQKLHSNIPASSVRRILLYYFLMQFIEFASGGLTLPKLVFKTFPANGMKCIMLYYLFPQAVY